MARQKMLFERLQFLGVAVIVSVSYTVLRAQLNIEYKGATWQQLYDLAAAVPFGTRVLVPLLSRPLVGLGFDVIDAFLVWEAVAALMTVLGIRHIAALYAEERFARVLALAFLLLLPLAYLLRFRWPIFYPYDTAALALMVWGLYCVLKHQWWALLILTALGALNRESFVLVTAVFCVLGIDRLTRSRYIALLLMQVLVYGGVRALIVQLTIDNPRPYGGQLALTNRGEWRMQGNIDWLANGENWLVLLATLGFLPLFYLALRRHILHFLRRWWYVVSAYLVMLFFVGNLYEPRIFGEVMVLLYVPVGLALASYLGLDRGVAEGTHRLWAQGDGRVVTLMSSSQVEMLARVAPLIFILGAFFVAWLLNQLGVEYFYR